MISYLPFFLLFLPIPAAADWNYYKHIFFDNSLTPERFYYSEGSVSEPSKLALDREKIPVDTEHYRTPPNALRLQWTSAPGGAWEASVNIDHWRPQEIDFEGDTLSFWCYSNQSLTPREMPRLQLVDSVGGFTAPLDLDDVVRSGVTRKWFRVGIPLKRFGRSSAQIFDPHKLQSVVFMQGPADGVEHILIVDEISIEPQPTVGAPVAAPRQLQAKSYELHVDLTWAPVNNPAVERYVVYRSFDGADFHSIGIQEPTFNRYADFVGATGKKVFYKVTASDRNYQESPFSQEASATTRPMTDDELLTMVQEANFRYFWERGHPVSGMALENIPGDDSMVATGATGFGIMALCVGIERGFITREQGLGRVMKIVSALEKADRFHGAFPHFWDGSTGKPLSLFGRYDNGGDLVETAFLMQGLLTARQYFARNVASETNLRGRITKLWEAVEWDWYRQSKDSGFLYWHSSPDHGWRISHKLIGFNETMAAYLLAIASPTHSVPASMYYSGWASQNDDAQKYRREWGGTNDGDHYSNGKSYYGIKLNVGVGSGGPLFFTQYSFLGFDPHSIIDRYTNYYQNNRNIALINHAYAVANPNAYPGYGDNEWGLTASDDPLGYAVHEPTVKGDNGTISPTAALASFPYTPEESMKALKHFYREMGARLWGVYGFRDAYNLKEDWFARVFIGIDQEPITVMIENYRSGLLWKTFMSNPEICAALERSGLHTKYKGSQCD